MFWKHLLPLRIIFNVILQLQVSEKSWHIVWSNSVKYKHFVNYYPMLQLLKEHITFDSAPTINNKWLNKYGPFEYNM